MVHENLKGISGLLCFLNHPMRESKVANDGVHGEAYNRLLSEARQEYNMLSAAPAPAVEPCKECGGVGCVYGGSNPDAPTAEVTCPVCHGTGREGKGVA